MEVLAALAVEVAVAVTKVSLGSRGAIASFMIGAYFRISECHQGLRINSLSSPPLRDFSCCVM
jgi:hypothetical protein